MPTPKPADREGWDEATRARRPTRAAARALVGITYLDAKGVPVRRAELHGVVARAGPDAVVLRLHGSDEEFTLPPALDAFEPAPPGEYRLRSTGEVVVNPDLLATWTVRAPRRRARLSARAAAALAPLTVFIMRALRRRPNGREERGRRGGPAPSTRITAPLGRAPRTDRGLTGRWVVSPAAYRR
jgi:hypothetical protein